MAYVAACWLVTAIVVARAASDTTTQAVVIVLAGLLVRTPSLRRAFLIGAAWLALSVATEIAMTLALHHGWFALLGPPSEGWRRDVVVMSWLCAPALFVRWPFIAVETRCA